MNDELMKDLIRQILAEPAFQTMLQGKGIKPYSGAERKPDCLVLLNYVFDLSTVLNNLQKFWATMDTLYLLPSESVKRLQPDLPEGLNWITPQEALEKPVWQSILLPTCSLNTLAKMALGIRDNPFTELIGRGLVQGIPIKLVAGALGLNDQTPPAYRDLYDGYLQKVQGYGVKVYANLTNARLVETSRESQVANENINGTLQAVENHSTIQDRLEPQQDILRFTKKFLADKDAYSFPEDSKVLIPQRVIISPLARDTLRMRRIELCQEKGEQRQCN
jgi:hypothetical protein